jgi:hypothetical protein
METFTFQEKDGAMTQVTFSSPSVRSAEVILISVEMPFASGLEASLELFSADEYETRWFATIPVTLDANGLGQTDFEVPAVLRETVMWPVRLSIAAQVVDFEPTVLCAIDSTTGDAPADVLARIDQNRIARFDGPVEIQPRQVRLSTESLGPLKVCS